MTIANVDDFGRNVRSAIRHHWVACRSVNDASEKAAPVRRTT